MFKFDFNVEPEERDGDVFGKSDADQINVKNLIADAPNIEWYGAQEILPSAEVLDNLDLFRLNSTEKTVGEVSFTHIVAGFLLQNINETSSEETRDISRAEQSHSDLIPGIYEGGAKVWECTDDLLEYMSANYSSNFWCGKRVLDLGCGSGLLGIFAHKCGALVTFQDYNKDVLMQITIPNILLNIQPSDPSKTEISITTAEYLEIIRSNARFFSGDWCKYAELTDDAANENKFDVILSSETIYNPQNQQKLLDTLDAKLSKNGFVLLAAKTYYFGVGGGLRQFEELIESDKRFRSNPLWRATDSVGREILALKRSC